MDKRKTLTYGEFGTSKKTYERSVRMIERYTDSEMASVWSEESKFKYWLRVELAVLKARQLLGEISCETYALIEKHAGFSVERINELEKLYDHDMIAFVETVRKSLRGTSAEAYRDLVHQRITSYDIEDPAAILRLRDVFENLIEALRHLEVALKAKAKEHQRTYMIARTHGQFAEPTTFGQLLLVYAEAVCRSIERFEFCYKHELSEGKLSGAVGTYAGLSPELEKKALAILGLVPAKAETQILQRDRHATLLSMIAVAGGTVEQACRTFWEMMRSDVHELEEPRKSTQRGSSAMPQKKNPIVTERLMGLARMLRAFASASLENIATPEGRDISQSSVERHILPDATTLLHYMVIKLTRLVERLVVFPEVMKVRLETESLGVWAAQRIRYALVEKGLPDSAAYDYVQRATFEAVQFKTNLSDVLRTFPFSNEDGRTGLSVLHENDLRACFNYHEYVGQGIEYLFRNL